VHWIKNAEDAHAFIVAGIIKALDVVAPLRAIHVKKGTSDLYLARDTLDCIEKRDCACLAKDPKYRALRNRATVLVARDKQRSNSDKLAKSMNKPKLLWQIANAALGKNRPTLPISIGKPDGAMTVGDAEAAAVLNRSYVTKIKILRDRTVRSALATS
jgi:hypothetical protein